MNILYLGPSSDLVDFIACADYVSRIEQKIEETDADFIVSYGYRHILPADLCQKFDGRAVNLHISMLPWNRGAHPNYWSHADGTPCGVTIHYIGEGLDKGDIAYQQLCFPTEGDTLRTSHEALQRAIERLFMANWTDIRNGNAYVRRQKQGGEGTYHCKADLPHLPLGWDTPVWQVQAERVERIGEMVCENVFA